jgi:hypothetical protein
VVECSYDRDDRAHFDGKFIVPDETVTLPRDTPLTVHVEAANGNLAESVNARQAAFDAFLGRAARRPVPRLADESLRRESIYED